MDLRAFGIKPRTWLEELHYQTKDRLLIAAGVFLLILALVVVYFGYGGFWVPEALIQWAS
jgi:energy-coupling factor transport system permease protein